MLATVLVLALSGAPQGISIRVGPFEARARATSAELALVTAAVERELKAQGYAVVSGDGKAEAFIAGTLEREAEQWSLHVTLVNPATQTELEDVRLGVGARDELPKAGAEAAKKLAAEIRARWGVRARLKL
jgi:hypothetical protein